MLGVARRTTDHYSFFGKGIPPSVTKYTREPWRLAIEFALLDSAMAVDAPDGSRSMPDMEAFFRQCSSVFEGDRRPLPILQRIAHCLPAVRYGQNPKRYVCGVPEPVFPIMAL